jgi:hypothetical protein
MRAKKSIRAWVARDKTGSLFLYFSEPLELPQEAFPNVKWEDNEPTRVYIRIA